MLRTLELSGHYDHLFFALVVSGWFLLDSWPALEARPARWGWAPLLLGLWLNVVGRVEGVLFPQVLGLQVAVVGLLALQAGWRGVSAMKFPLLFFFLALPLPRATLDATTGGLRQLATLGAIKVLGALDIPAVQQGSEVVLGETRVAVDASCSGLQGLLAFLALSGLLARSLSGALRPLLLLSAAFPMAFLANLLRVLVLSRCAASAPTLVQDPWLHGALGLAVYALALLVLLWLRGLLTPPDPPSLAASAPLPQPRVVAARGPLAALGSGALLATLLSVLLPCLEIRPLPPVLRAGTWDGQVLELSPAVRAALYVRYRRPDIPGFVDFYAISGSGANVEAHAPSACFPGSGFVPRPAPSIEGLPRGSLVELYTRGQERYVSVFWVRKEGRDFAPAELGSLKYEASLRRLLLRPPLPLVLVRLVTPWDDLAQARLRTASRELLPALLSAAQP